MVAKGDLVTFITRGVTKHGKVVRVKKDGLITIDVPEDPGWWDVPASRVNPE